MSALLQIINTQDQILDFQFLFIHVDKLIHSIIYINNDNEYKCYVHFSYKCFQVSKRFL